MSWPAFSYQRPLAAVFTLAAFAMALVAGRDATAEDAKSPPAHQALLKDAKSTTGLLPVHQKGTNLYLELGSSEYDNEYIVLISIAKGIGQTPLLGGYSWGFGDDWVWTFRKIDDKVHVIRKNVRFRASKGTPEATAVGNAYTDSIVFSLPIAAPGPKGGDLVDFSPIFMSDLPQISQVLPGFVFARDRSSWAAVKNFKDNLELQVAATYASGGQMEIDTVADSRGVSLNVHYSISKVPSSSYQPRLADDRVGYFLTVVKDFSKTSDRDQFVRYINRWHLEKPSGAGDGPTSPKQPVIFWIEKTVPFKYRPAVRDGIAEWNKAFEAAGWLNAIEVRQQPDNADWDPEDVNYNTFRWITSNAGFAMGPSRVNPYTGQILDADIIFDADFLTFWKNEFETLTAAQLMGYETEPSDNETPIQRASREFLARNPHASRCMLRSGTSHQFAFGAAAIAAAADPKVAAELQEKLIMQGLKEVTMHEVGHTLGLRHNFKASKWRSLQELNDPGKANQQLVASVMDYTPANIVPKGAKQGDFYQTALGPYDIWAIEYGYKSLDGGTTGEKKDLDKIASRSGERALQFSTDEDTTGSSPDPDSNRFDLGSDPLEYAKTRAQLVSELIPGLVDRMVKEGDDYTLARRALGVLLSQQGQAMMFAARQIGGLKTSRSHKGDKDAPPPFAVIDPKQQRDALTLLEQSILSDKPFQFPPELLNQLAATNWSHWGMTSPARKDYSVHDVALQWQDMVLGQLLSTTTLKRLHDAELRVAADKDAMTAAELIERTTKAVFAEVDSIKDGQFSNRKPAISSLRRNLQRSHLRRLANLALGKSGAPEDCQTVAYADLSALQGRIETLLKSNAKLDTYSRAHLMESASRIQKVLDARITVATP